VQAHLDPGFATYVRARQRTFVRAAYLICGDEHQAQDLVQQALIKLATRWSRIKDENPDGYVRRILYNDAVSSWRRTGRERPSAVPADRVVPDPSGAVAERADLIAALRELAPRQRAVIVLRYFEDRTEAETAEILGISIGTVKSQAHAALANLRVNFPALTTSSSAQESSQ
jgi:RNA polymerase sigma-70 factor (sigma-E family)